MCEKEKGSHAKSAKENLSELGELSVKKEKDPHAENAKTAKKKLGELCVKKNRVLTQRAQRPPRNISVSLV